MADKVAQAWAEYQEMERQRSGVLTLNRRSGTQIMDYITHKYGAGIADQVRAKAKSTPPAPQPSTPTIDVSKVLDPKANSFTNLLGPKSGPGQPKPVTSPVPGSVAPGRTTKAGTPLNPTDTGPVTDADIAKLTAIMRSAGEDEPTIADSIKQSKTKSDYNNQLDDARSQLAMKIVGSADIKSVNGTVAMGGLGLGIYQDPITGASRDTYYKAVGEPTTWSATDVGALQARLAQAYPTYLGTYIQGVYDASTRKAFSQALADAQTNNQTIGDVLQGLAVKSRSAAKGSSPSFTPYKPQADAAVESGIVTAFQKAVGRNPSDTELQTFKASYGSMELNAYNENVNATRAAWDAAHITDPATGAVTSNPSAVYDYGQAVNKVATPGEMATQSIYKTPEAQQYHGTELGIALRNLIGGSRQ